MAQANSGQRRRVRAVRQGLPAACSSELEVLQKDDLLAGWPDFPIPSSALLPPRLVVREVATQHEVAWADASTTTGCPSFNARVQGDRRR